MKTRERIACAYPGKAVVGLSLWLVEDGTVVRVAMGSAPTSAVAGYLERFDPDLLVVEESRKENLAAAAFRATARSLRYAHPDWRKTPFRASSWRPGPYAQNAWRIGWHELVWRGPYRLSKLDISPLTPKWVEANAPWRPRAA